MSPFIEGSCLAWQLCLSIGDERQNILIWIKSLKSSRHAFFVHWKMRTLHDRMKFLFPSTRSMNFLIPECEWFNFLTNMLMFLYHATDLLHLPLCPSVTTIYSFGSKGVEIIHTDSSYRCHESVRKPVLDSPSQA